MKGVKILAGIVFASVLVIVTALAAQEVSAARGKALFNDPKLGTTGKSCNDCHPNGKGAEKMATKENAAIERIVNGCITQSIKGKALDTNSAEMQSMVLYIKSLAEKPAEMQKKAPIGC